MAATTAPRARKVLRPKTGTELHRAWLELVETDGPFLAIPPLKRVWPQGMPTLADDRLDSLREAKPAFDRVWEKLDKEPDDDIAQTEYRHSRDTWVQTVLRDVVGWQEALDWGTDSAPGVSAVSPDRRVTVTPAAVLRGPDGVGALVSVIDTADSLHQAGFDGWAASAIDRMEQMLRTSGVQVGIVTDGRWWALVSARPNAMVASGIVDAQTWTEEPLTRNAFLTVIARQYIIGGDPNERLPKLFEESVAAAEEITEALGAQVRRAVEGLIQAFSETAARPGQNNALPKDPHETYSAAVTVMMRIVFLLFAEERGLLPHNGLFQQGYGISGELDLLERRQLDEGDESLDSTFLTWHRLLATSQALYQGASFENLRMPAYGGSLFDPEKYPFLTAVNESGTLALPISDLVMLYVLRSVQVAELKGGDARRISFRDIDVEQIGYIYEGLLGYSCLPVKEPYVGLIGPAGAEPEIPLTVLEGFGANGATPQAVANAIIAWAKDNQPAASTRSASALTKLIAQESGEDADRILRAVVSDDDYLRERLQRWINITRLDLRRRPTVFLKGGLLVTETPSRKNAGAHYTPRSLAEEVVKHALEPLCYSPGPHQTPDRERWRLRSPEQILALKVADIAAGSGAFLVAAARYLAARLLEAWTERNAAQTPHGDLYQHAVREVVAHCLYGADINAMAVEMCKLSLWLVSLDPKLPFSFVDDKILHGNSLLGLTDLQQLRTLHIEHSEHGRAIPASLDLEETLKEAITLRTALASEVEEYNPQRSTTAKRRQLDDLHQITAHLRDAANGVIAAGLRLGGKPGKILDEAYQSLALAVAEAAPKDGVPGNGEFLQAIIAKGLTPTVATDYERWQLLHWILEVPDVMQEHQGFDAVIGNPPFLGGQKLTGAMGENVRDWLVQQVAFGARGSVDIVAYFFLRAFALLRPTGVLGLLATKTIAQGVGKEVCLDQLTGRGMTIFRAVKSAAWPSGSANLEYAAIWGSRGVFGSDVLKDADGVKTHQITNLLEPASDVDGDPAPLVENAGIAFQGCIISGPGFVLSGAEAEELISRDERNSEVVVPYLIGNDLNSHPRMQASRWVIDFNDWTEQSAAKYADAFDRVNRLVRPLRSGKSRKALRERWWQFEEKRPGMRSAISDLDEVLVIAQTSSTLMPARVPRDQVLDQTLIVFATDSFAFQAVLSSSAHQFWVIKYGLGMRKDPRYTPSDVFVTFPFPRLDGEGGQRLELACRALDRARRDFMGKRSLGLTKLYGLINNPHVDDPEVADMRLLHCALDEAVMAAYGWTDIPLDYGFDVYRQMRRWTVGATARGAILDRLLAENLKRAGAQPKTTSKVKRIGTRGSANDGQGTLM